MNEQEKRELFESLGIDPALAQDAIVVSVEIEHILPGVDPVGCPNGYTIADGIFNLPYPEEGIPIEEFRYEAEGIHGQAGEAWAIIMPRRGEQPFLDV